MVEISKSALLYLERREPLLYQTRRAPGPRMDTASNLAHLLPMEPPAPIPEVLRDALPQPPDGAHTQPWPHGSKERV